MVSWLFDTACDINVNGKNHFLIAPKPGGTLTFAEAEYNSQYGTVCCRWEKENSGIYYKVIVPANTEATFVYPSGKTVSLGPGIHSLCK
jgi:alpha-L-rhamnosidase